MAKEINDIIKEIDDTNGVDDYTTVLEKYKDCVVITKDHYEELRNVANGDIKQLKQKRGEL